MQQRVRLLYVEFMYLLPQLNEFFTAGGPANGKAASPTTPKFFFLRVPEAHPVCSLLRNVGAAELQCRPPTSSLASAPSTADATDAAEETLPIDACTAASTTSQVTVFKLSRETDLAQLLDAAMPANWDNNEKLSKGASASASAGPTAEAAYRARVQRLFYANALVPVGSPEWKRCLARGRYELRGIHNVLRVRKYRALHKRYGWASQLSRTELEAAWGGNTEEVDQVMLGLSNKDVYGYADGEATTPGGPSSPQK